MKAPRLSLNGWELLVAIGLLGILAAVSIPAAWRAREASMRTSCQNNLKQVGIMFKMYAGEHKDFYPPLSPIPGNWMFDVSAVYPDYLTDLHILVCPDSPFASRRPFDLRSNAFHPGAPIGSPHPDCVSSLYYVYTGYAIGSDEYAYVVYRERNRNPGAALVRDEITATVPRGARTGMRGGGQSGLPVMWDRMFPDEQDFSHRSPWGGNVLHMDGHVEFVPYSYYNNTSYFPITGLSAETFGTDVPQLSLDCYGF